MLGSGVLDGVRVLDLSGPIGAYCTRLLADLGADVVLVEPPNGDPLRRMPPFRDDDPDASLPFAYYHASKRSVVVGERDPNALARLGASADVVVLSPSPRSSLPGWDPDALTVTWAPHAIVCAITPFGLTGPNAGWRATPMLSYAMGGYMSRVGPVDGPPVTIPGRLCWDEAGVHAAVCVLAALRAAEVVGPQGIDLSVHEVLTGKDFMLEEYDAVGLNPLGRLVEVGWPPSGTFECADGPFSVAAHQVRHWDAFLEMLEHPAELADPALHDPLVRRERYEDLGATIRELVRHRSREDLVARGQVAGLPCGMLHRPTGFVTDRQLASRGAFVATPTPWGESPMPAPGAGFVATPSLVRERTSAPVVPGDDDVSWPVSPNRPPVEVRRATRALQGIRVLSFGAFVAGNTTAAILGQLGADVIKIEAREHPEVLRTAAYAYGEPSCEPSGVPNTIMYASLSRSARNLSIDITTLEGRELFHRLVGVADVVIENFGRGTLDGWGLSFDALRAQNPRIVVTSMSGYGRTGPRASYLAYGRNISNFVGLTYLWNYSHGTLSDYVTAAHAAVGTLAALEHVAATGEGVSIDAAHVEAMAATMPEAVLEALVNQRDLPPPGNVVAGSVFSGVFRCLGHDAWVTVELEDLADWHGCCELLDVPVAETSEADVPGFRPVLEAALHGWAAERTALTAARALQHAGLAAAVVQSSEDVWRDAQLWSRSFPNAFPQPDLGSFHYTESPYRLRATPGRVGHVGRRLGADTADVLREWLSLPAAEIDRLLDAGVAFQA
jgi:crotonobetainyl-CoA:carnitine CoA-transferase CaiB-like acyl-CoA transferase